MRAIVIQLQPSADKSRNIESARLRIEQALGDGGEDVIVSLPEMWTCLGADRATKLSQSEILPTPGDAAEPGSAYGFLGGMARRHRIYLHGGSIGERAGEHLFNTTVVFGPDGRELARYRKIHMFDVVTPSGQGYRESSMFGAGDRVVTCHAGDLTLGLTICYDLRFPELFLALRREGAAAIFVPSAFTVETGRDHWEVLLRARAIETQCYIVAAATCGIHTDAAGKPRETFGHSLICDPWGRILATLPNDEGHAAADIDMTSLAKVRAAMPVLDHRRLG
jgi:nitrilase